MYLKTHTQTAHGLADRHHYLKACCYKFVEKDGHAIFQLQYIQEDQEEQPYPDILFAKCRTTRTLNCYCWHSNDLEDGESVSRRPTNTRKYTLFNKLTPLSYPSVGAFKTETVVTRGGVQPVICSYLIHIAQTVEPMIVYYVVSRCNNPTTISQLHLWPVWAWHYKILNKMADCIVQLQ